MPKTLPTLVQTALSNCEPDLRTPLLSNIVLTGGGSLLQGTAERLNNELIRGFGPVRDGFSCGTTVMESSLSVQKVKLHAGGNIVERRFGAWIGGSILASLGTFHQLWISAEEWQVGSFSRQNLEVAPDLDLRSTGVRLWVKDASKIQGRITEALAEPVVSRRFRLASLQLCAVPTHCCICHPVYKLLISSCCQMSLRQQRSVVPQHIARCRTALQYASSWSRAGHFPGVPMSFA